MLVRKIIESYERELVDNKSNARPPPPPRSLRAPRVKRPNLHIVTEDGSEPQPALQGRMVPQARSSRPNSLLPASALPTPDTSHTFGCPNPTSVPFTLSHHTRLHNRSSSGSGPSQTRKGMSRMSPSTSTLKARRQDRYSRDEAALRNSLLLTLPAPTARALHVAQLEHATAMFDKRARETKVRLQELRTLLALPEEEAKMDAATYDALLKERWMEERWLAKAAETQSSLAKTAATLGADKENAEPNATQDPALRRQANLAKFFAQSPTQTAILSRHRRQVIASEVPRRMTHRDLEPPQLSSWPLGAHLKRPFKATHSRPRPVDSTPPSSSSSASQSVARRPSHTRKRMSRLSSHLQPVTEYDAPDVDSTPTWPQSVPPTAASDAFPTHDTATATTNRSSIASSLSSSEWVPGAGSATIYYLSPRSVAEILADAPLSLPLPDYVTRLLAEFAHIQDDIALPFASELSFKQPQRHSAESYDSGVLVRRPSVDSYHYEFPYIQGKFRRSLRLSIGGRTSPPAVASLRAIREEDAHASPPRTMRHRPSFLRHRSNKSEDRSAATSRSAPRTPTRTPFRLSDAEAPTGVMERMRKRVSVLGRVHR